MKTVKDLKLHYLATTHFKKGKACFSNESYEIKERAIYIGSNSGIYGWNWSLYYDEETDTLYCECYRNVPTYLVEK